MPTYVFRLHVGPDTAPRVESVEVRDDREAQTLAELRLLFSSSFKQVEVQRDGVELARLHHDSESLR